MTATFAPFNCHPAKTSMTSMHIVIDLIVNALSSSSPVLAADRAKRSRMGDTHRKLLHNTSTCSPVHEFFYQARLCGPSWQACTIPIIIRNIINSGSPGRGQIKSRIERFAFLFGRIEFPVRIRNFSAQIFLFSEGWPSLQDKPAPEIQQFSLFQAQKQGVSGKRPV